MIEGAIYLGVAVGRARALRDRAVRPERLEHDTRPDAIVGRKHGDWRRQHSHGTRPRRLDRITRHDVIAEIRSA
jgi:hypothetical protein